MAALTVSALRQRIAAAVEALSSPSAWKESSWSFDALPNAEPGAFAHLAFAVGVPSTTFPSPVESSRTTRNSTGGRVRTIVGVRWLFRLRADNQVADYDSMLDAELVLMQALTSTSHLPNLHIAISGMSRLTVGDGAWAMSQLTLAADHQLALS